MDSVDSEPARVQEAGIIKVKGKEYFRELTWNQDVMDDYTTEVTSMRMKDNETAEIEWTFSGKLNGVPVSGTVTSSLYLNVLTGRIETHHDEVKLTGNPLGSALYTLKKWGWAQKLQARQLGDSVRCHYEHTSRMPYLSPCKQWDLACTGNRIFLGIDPINFASNQNLPHSCHQQMPLPSLKCYCHPLLPYSPALSPAYLLRRAHG